MNDVRYFAVSGVRAIDYDEETVAFNPETWETHVLNAAAAEVLSLCTEAPRTPDDIARALAQWLDADDARDAREHAGRILDELQALGLIGPLAAAPPR